MSERLKKTFLFLSLFVFFQSGCSLSSFNRELCKNSFKINNLLDLNGDNKSELVFWNTSNQLLQTNSSKSCFLETISISNTDNQLFEIGNVGNIPIFGDFTGDGSFDYGIYEPDAGNSKWSLIDGLTMTTFLERFGLPGDLPIPNDYDGDGKCDFVVYRPSNSGFYGNLSDKNKTLEIHFGITGDIPVPKDYDGDSKADLAVYTSASGAWLIRSSKNGLTKQTFLGGADYLPIPGDYDGDCKADIAAWNYKNNDCKITYSSFLKGKLSEQARHEIQEKLKNVNCFPISSDYDGDGKSELAFWNYDKSSAYIFRPRGNNVDYEEVKLGVKDNSKPINFYLLNKFLYRDKKINTSTVIINGLKSIALCKNGTISCQNCSDDYRLPLENQKNQIPFFADFDGDYNLDQSIWSEKTGDFLFYSSKEKRNISIPLGTKSGIPFIGHFNDDHITDAGVYASNGTFYLALTDKKTNLYKKEEIKVSGGGTKTIIGDFDGDFIDDLGAYNSSTKNLTVRLSSNNKEKAIKFEALPGEIYSGDFDGDGKQEICELDLENKTLTYLSSVFGNNVTISLNNKINGIPFISDVDLDFISDIVFYNPSTTVFGLFRSSDAYTYNEFSFGKKDSKLINKNQASKL